MDVSVLEQRLPEKPGMLPYPGARRFVRAACPHVYPLPKSAVGLVGAWTLPTWDSKSRGLFHSLR